MLLGLGGLTALFILLAPWLMPPLYPDYHPLLIGLSQVLFPIVALLGVSGIVVGILNSYDEFSIPALTPVAWNLVIIAGLVFGVPRVDGTDDKLYVYAGSILVGTIVQFLLPLPWLRGRDGRLQMVIDWRDPAVKRVFKLMLPVTLGLGLININALIDGVIGGWLISKNAPSTIDAAFRIYMLPQGVFSVAVATVLFPSLARLAARRDMDGFRSTSSLGLRQIVVPARAGERRHRGARRADDAPDLPARRVHGAPDDGRRRVPRRALPRAHVQRDDADAEPLVLQPAGQLGPDGVALGNLFLNALLDVAFSPLGIWGIPLATSFVNIAGTAALLVVLRRRLGRIDFGAIASSFVRVLARRRDRGRRRLRGLEAARLAVRRVAPGPVALAPAGRHGRRRRLSRPWPAPCVCARCRRYSPCAAASAAAEHSWTSSTSATSRSSRTSTTASRRSPIASSS